MTRFATAYIENGQLVEKDVVDVELDNVPSKDPLAFMFGFQKGQRYVRLKKENRYTEIDHGSNHSELAPEYLRGFLLGYRGILVPEGTKIRKGEERTFALSHLNLRKV